MIKSRWFIYLNVLFLLLFVVCGVSAFIAYSSIPSIKNIRSCFTTSLYKVHLCPTSSNYVRYNQLPQHLIYALIVSEDASFYNHKGFDWHEIQESFRQNLDAGRWVRGGSTITQQLAKNLYLSKDKSLVRKFKEFFIAYKIEETLSKKEILEKYFNVVEFGPNIFGILKASQFYFKKHPSALYPEESAYLIAILPNPQSYTHSFRKEEKLSTFNKRRIQTILIRLKARDKINEDEYQAALSRMELGLWAKEDESSFWQRLMGGTPETNANPQQDAEPANADEATALETQPNTTNDEPAQESINSSGESSEGDTTDY